MEADFRWPFDIVHAHSPFSAGIVARQIARSRDIPFVATLHTKYDSSSLVPKEASSCACPTVFVEGSTTSQGIIDGHNGFLAKNEAYDYAAKIKRIITTEGLATKVGQVARDTLYIPWVNIVRKVYERYVYLIDKNRKRQLSY